MTWQGGEFGERARCVLAPNANEMTLDGTNTWVLREPGARRSVVVDPGPPAPEHLDAVAAAAGEVGVVLLTHHHPDHAESAREFAERVGCGVRALDPAYRLGAAGLTHGDVVELDGLEVRVLGTPGHTADSLSFLLPAEETVLTGDTVLGRGTTVVAHPDGQLGAYLESLDRLHALAVEQELAAIWPGHGPVIDDALAALDFYITHRRERLAQVEQAVLDQTGEQRLDAAMARVVTDAPGAAAESSGGPGPTAQSSGHPATAVTPRSVVEQVYADVSPVLWGAAELSVRAQLDYLAAR